MVHQYKLKKSVYDGTEPIFSKKHHIFSMEKVPQSIDLRKKDYLGPVLDQKQLGSCASNATSTALRFSISTQLNTKSNWQPSRLFLYYFCRVLEEDDIMEDTGCSLVNMMKNIALNGTCSELNCPYNILNFTTKPSKCSILAAKTHISKFSYLCVPQTLVHLKQALLVAPVIFGIQVYDSFESDTVIKSGIVPLPASTETLLGGHALLIVGYDDTSQYFTIQNSWGNNVGQNGFFLISYSYILNPILASDFFQITYFK